MLRRYLSEIDSGVFVGNCKRPVVDDIISTISNKGEDCRAIVVYYKALRSTPEIVLINYRDRIIDNGCGYPVIWMKKDSQ